MDWLSPEVANRLQLVTLPLEIIGLMLATVEVRFPTLTQALNSRLLAVNRAVELSDSRWRENNPRISRIMMTDHRLHLPTPGWLQWTLISLLLVAILGTVGIAGLKMAPDLNGASDRLRELLDSFIWFVYLPVMAAALLSVTAIQFIARFAKDRAMGTLGIFVAGLGVLGEVYQFATALVDVV